MLRPLLPSLPSGRKQLESAGRRRGGIVVLSAFFLVAILGIVAFTVDVGLIVLVKQQLQTAANASALAAAQELATHLEQNPAPGSPAEQASLSVARTAAVTVAAANPNGYDNSTTLDLMADIEFGNRSWDSTTGQWLSTWGSGPYNAVRTSVRRTSSRGNTLPLSFAPVIGHQQADLSEQAVAALMSGVGFTVSSGGHAPVLPFAVDVDSWMALETATEPDDWSWDTSTGTVSQGSDGILELAIFPNGPDVSLPSGNRGTINIGNPNNSTADLRRQIRDGLNTGDLAFHGGSIDFSQGPIQF